MTYIQPWVLTKDSREAFLAWLDGEGLNAAEIANDGRFSVHAGIVSGNRFVSEDPNRPKYKTHFRVPQKHALPELKEL